MKEQEIDFIARRYKKGAFSTRNGWRRLGLGSDFRWKRIRTAAAVTAVIALSATATIIYNYHNYAKHDIPVPVENVSVKPILTVRAIDFEETPLTIVVEKIRETYGVEILDIPENADELTLSLHYEGSAEDLIETINDILGTDMKVENR